MARPADITYKGFQLLAIRTFTFLSLAFGLRYLQWRWMNSLNMAQWWISVPLVVAETYTMIDGLLFGMTVWRSGHRRRPAPLDRPVSVDVLITTYNELIDLVMETARAACRIKYPHATYILDDGARDELRDLAQSEGIGYITRSEDWVDRPLHAKAGNLNNALMVTSGEFLLILDSDQIPDENILDETLGYFADPQVALVQTPQHFWNVAKSDLLGAQATLFYGPIMQGKDGWNAAFFCGSNAVLRREALMQLALAGYVRDVADVLKSNLRGARKLIAQAKHQVPDSPSIDTALAQIDEAIDEVRSATRRGVSLAEATFQFQRKVSTISREAIHRDLQEIRRDLEEIGDVSGVADALSLLGPDDAVVDELAQLDTSPLGALSALMEMIESLDVNRAHESQPLMPLAIISVTEDMATAMRLHALGWKSVYHDEILANGLAPEDLGSAMQQRLRWAQGTLQVMLRENPLTQKGLSAAQRLMYFATMWNYLSGFSTLIFATTPMAYLLLNVRPVHAYSVTFLEHLVPYLLCNQLMFVVVSRKIPTWRGQQYSFALFPLWIRATFTTVANVYFGRKLNFVVTPKSLERTSRSQMLKVVWPQIVTIGLLVLSTIVGVIKLYVHAAPSVEGVWLNVVWVALDVLLISVVIRAASYRGFEVTNP
jgi:cellulose synthase (UDP-forming)